MSPLGTGLTRAELLQEQIEAEIYTASREGSV
jgi:hypothetical protein